MCERCDVETYEVMECCASGSCEVCGGLQGRVRASVAREIHGGA